MRSKFLDGTMNDVTFTTVPRDDSDKYRKIAHCGEKITTVSIGSQEIGAIVCQSFWIGKDTTGCYNTFVWNPSYNYERARRRGSTVLLADDLRVIADQMEGKKKVRIPTARDVSFGIDILRSAGINETLHTMNGYLYAEASKVVSLEGRKELKELGWFLDGDGEGNAGAGNDVWMIKIFPEE